MTLSLDVTMRLNLQVMMDAIERQGRREDWAICALQKRIELTDAERAAIGYKEFQDQNGRTIGATWNPPNGNAPELFQIELDEADTKRIVRAVENYRMIASRDRHWWNPLIAQLPPIENEAAKVATP